MRRRSVEFKAAERRATIGRQDVANGERTADDAEAARVHMLKVLIAVSKFRRVLKSRHAETSFRKIKAADSFRKGSLTCRAPNVDWADVQFGAALGKGAYATVYAVVLKSTGERVAVKVLHPEQATSELALADLRSESVLLSHVDHPNVMRCLFTGTSPEGAPFIVTPQLATVLSAVLPKSLDDVGWCARHSQVKQWPLTRAVRCGVQLGRALRHCHHYAFPGHVLLHRDLKPDNIGLMADDSVKLFDFGLSKIVPIESRGGNGPKLTGQTGSLRYMAPEVCLEKPYDESADVYSFAVILWQMASHDVPFVGMGGLGGFVERVAKGGLRPPMKKSFPPSLQSTLASCWHADAAQRPSLMDAVPTLEALLAELDPSTPPPSPRTSTSYPATPSSPLPANAAGAQQGAAAGWETRSNGQVSTSSISVRSGK